MLSYFSYVYFYSFFYIIMFPIVSNNYIELFAFTLCVVLSNMVKMKELTIFSSKFVEIEQRLKHEYDCKTTEDFMFAYWKENLEVASQPFNRCILYTGLRLIMFKHNVDLSVMSILFNPPKEYLFYRQLKLWSLYKQKLFKQPDLITIDNIYESMKSKLIVGSPKVCISIHLLLLFILRLTLEIQLPEGYLMSPILAKLIVTTLVFMVIFVIVLPAVTFRNSCFNWRAPIGLTLVFISHTLLIPFLAYHGDKLNTMLSWLS